MFSAFRSGVQGVRKLAASQRNKKHNNVLDMADGENIDNSDDQREVHNTPRT